MATIEKSGGSGVVKGLDLLFLEVGNLDESLVFYHDSLGFEIESKSPDADPPIATVRGGRLRITLVQQPETMLKRGRGVHFVLGVGDVDNYYRELTERGVKVSRPADEGWGGRFIAVRDPDSYRLFFVTWEGEQKK